jgi:hypothetical protein
MYGPMRTRSFLSLTLMLALAAQGPFCSWLCSVPDQAGTALAALPSADMEHAPCHGGMETPQSAPSERDCGEECPGCSDGSPALAARAADSGAEAGALLVAALPSATGARSEAPLLQQPFRPPDERPPKRSLILLKSSLLL